MKVDQKLLEKFFRGQCTAREAKIVSAFLNDERNREQYLNSAEWETFVPETHISEEISKRINVAVNDAINQKRERRIVRMKYLRYAAAVMVVFSIGLLLIKPLRRDSNHLTAKNYKTAAPVRIIPTVIKNTSEVKRSYDLPDGSIVEIEPGSEISYVPFDHSRRDITLKGEALFRVHKDKARPFTVYANQLATTALGTIFKVSAFEHQLLTSVKLIEGKVVVRPQSRLLAGGVKTVYLSPGKMFTVNMKSYAALVKSFTVPVAQQKETFDNNKTIITDQSIVFDNEALARVFDTLAEKLNLNIAYSAKEVDKKLFSGQYEYGRDDVDTFLNTLASLNNLTVEKTVTGYVIRKK